MAERVPFRAGRVTVACLVLLIGETPALAAQPAPAATTEARLDALFGGHEPYRKFLADLQRAVAAGDRQQIAAMVSYPLRTNLGGHVVKLGPKQLLAHFDELLPPKTLAAITAQSFDTLFANSQGVMIGEGEVWFAAICAARDCSAPPIMITAINPPPP
jgi:hypothetical protein